MTKLIVESDNDWTKRKIRDTIQTEKEFLRKVVQKVDVKIKKFEKKYGKLGEGKLYGKVEDMELLEWEGEIETAARLKEKLAAFEEIVFEYK